MSERMEPLTDRAVRLPECVCAHASAGLLACGGPCVECVQPVRACVPRCAHVTHRGERRSQGRKGLVRGGFASAGPGLFGPAPSLRPRVSMEEAHSLHRPPVGPRRP